MQVYDIPIDHSSRETTLHGTFDFPVAVYHSVMSRNVLGFTNWHWHKEMQLCVVTFGSIEFIVSQRRFLLQKGQGIFINSGFLHTAKPTGNPDSSYLCLNFHPKLLCFFDGSIFQQNYVLPYRDLPAFSAILMDEQEPWQHRILESVQNICQLTDKQPFAYEYECALLLGEIWLKLIRNHSVQVDKLSARNSLENQRLQTILDYINVHHGESFTIADVAAQAALSASECCRFFKKMTGETIFSYVQMFRLSKGAQLLRSTDGSISEIAYSVGFGSSSYFIEVFRKYMHTTPLQYRKHLTLNSVHSDPVNQIPLEDNKEDDNRQQ